MRPISFKRHRFPLSVRDVEELLAERGIEVSRDADTGLQGPPLSGAIA